MFKKILLVIIILSQHSCGYTPVYKFNENTNFRIKEIDFEGDRLVNNFLESRFSKYYNINEGDQFSLDIKSSFIKKTISKKSSGSVDVYKLGLNIIISVKEINVNNSENFEGFNTTYTFNEEFLVNNDNDKFEEKNYENSIKENLTNTIFDKFLLSLISR